MSKVLFVIVSYNARRYMQECIQSIRAKVAPGSYKIAVTDNASTDGIAEWLEAQEDILLIRNHENKGFGPGCNQAVAATAGTEYETYDIFLLNNDTVMTSTAVPRMVETLYSAADIGAVGCMSSYAGNRQEYPVVFDTTEEYVKYGESLSIPKADALLEKVRLNGFAMLIRRNLWDEIGGFDEDFAPGYYEDDALSIEILKRGYRLLLRRDSFIYHVGSASFVKAGTNRLSLEHHELFIQKYGFDILKYVYPCGAIMSRIPFMRDAEFTVLHIGCGLGAELKALRSLYPGSHLYGVESDPRLYAIASKTEVVYQDIAAALEHIPRKSVNLLILDSNSLPTLAESDKAQVVSLCVKNAVELNRLHEYDDFNFDGLSLVIWDTALFSSSVSELLRLRGVMSISFAEKEIAKIMDSVGIPKEHILRITPDNFTIVPYLAAHFARKPESDPQKRRAAVMDIFLKRHKELTESTDTTAFKKDSGLTVSFGADCRAHTAEIKELLEESNLLNDTEFPADPGHIERLLNNEWNECGYVTARDKYGDYGVVGFYCYNLREKRMLCQALSWVASSLEIEPLIKEHISGAAAPALLQNSNKIRILIKGDRSLSPIEDYLIGGNITTEYTDCTTRNLSIEGDGLPSLVYRFGYHIILCSLLQYDYSSWESDGDACLGKLFETLDRLYEDAPGKPTIILLLGSERFYDTTDTLSCNLAELNRELNPIIAEYAADHDRLRLINVTDHIQNAKDFADDINHFGVRVFSDLAEQVCRYINEKVDELIGS